MITREYTVWCDQSGCGRWKQFAWAANAAQAARLARRDGWIVIKGKYACPDCAIGLTKRSKP